METDDCQDAPDAAAARGQLSDAFDLIAEMTRGFASSPDLEGTLTQALRRIVSHLSAEVGSLWLLEGDLEGGRVVCKASVGPHPITGVEIPVSKGIVGRCVRENRCESVLDAASDPAFARHVDAESGLVTKSLLCAPLAYQDEVLGAIQVINKLGGDGCFGAGDLEPLRALSTSAALAIAHDRLAAARVESQRVLRELELAAEIQRGLLPEALPGFPVYGLNVPARTVSGDFFDFLALPDGRIAFCLGDVSGKGMNAALLMSRTVSVWRCLVKTGDEPGALLARLNDEICETTTRGMFVTMVTGLLEPEEGRVRFANAGHEPPLWHRKGCEVQRFPAESPPVGIAAGLSFPLEEVPLREGTLYLCSDGLTEAGRESGPGFGEKELPQWLERVADAPLSARVDAIAKAGQARGVADDLTLLGVAVA